MGRLPYRPGVDPLSEAVPSQGVSPDQAVSGAGPSPTRPSANTVVHSNGTTHHHAFSDAQEDQKHVVAFTNDYQAIKKHKQNVRAALQETETAETAMANEPEAHTPFFGVKENGKAQNETVTDEDATMHDMPPSNQPPRDWFWPDSTSNLAEEHMQVLRELQMKRLRELDEGIPLATQPWAEEHAIRTQNDAGGEDTSVAHKFWMDEVPPPRPPPAPRPCFASLAQNHGASPPAPPTSLAMTMHSSTVAPQHESHGQGGNEEPMPLVFPRIPVFSPQTGEQAETTRMEEQKQRARRRIERQRQQEQKKLAYKKYNDQEIERIGRNPGA